MNCIGCGQPQDLPVHRGCDQRLVWALFWTVWGEGANIYEVAERVGITNAIDVNSRIIRRAS